MIRCELTLAVVSLILLVACGPATEAPHMEEVSSSSDSWLQGTIDERFDTVTKHLRGLDMAMIEIGYRYQELYRAGASDNWPYANYQVNKIRQSLANALERRPKRSVSAQEHFLPALEVMDEVVAQEDREQFIVSFVAFTNACNTCHVAEEVPSFVVVPPDQRTTPIE